MQTDSGQINIMDVTVEEYYQLLDERLRRIRGMNLARWQLIKQTAISILVAWFALEAGADPTFTVGVIALINGLSLADLAAIWGGEGRGPPATRGTTKKKQQDDELPEKENEAKKR